MLPKGNETVLFNTYKCVYLETRNNTVKTIIYCIIDFDNVLSYLSYLLDESSHKLQQK